jgi:aminoglycoside phosphotransferase family enzyme
MNTAENVETFSHRVTDVFQHHKKLMNERKENEAIREGDVRVLNTEELSLASDLTSLTTKTFL